ncbi:lipoprotein [Spiroplasma endosymbiont of Polydrusus cervinus]|uniref:lipoprotein n=1 Tax=Spiroplasma endosymbiont of Polydrusus cervinus TaxID=3066287 RepID=UPI0030D59AD0
MKKILSILAAITLIGTSTTSLVSCDKVTNGENKKDSKKEPNFKPELPPENGNWKLIDKNNSINNDKFDNEFSEENDKWYLFNNKNDLYLNYLVKNNGNIKRFKNNIWTLNTYNNDYAYFNTANIKSIYRWDSNGKPEKPTINKDTGEVIDWK